MNEQKEKKENRAGKGVLPTQGRIQATKVAMHLLSRILRNDAALDGSLDIRRRPEGENRTAQNFSPASRPGLFSVRPSGDWNTHKKMSKLHRALQATPLQRLFPRLPQQTGSDDHRMNRQFIPRRNRIFRSDGQGTPPPLRTSSPPKYPAAATSPEAINIRIRYRQSPKRDIASFTTSLQTAKASKRPKAGQTNL
jgi:hypothetical protein